MSKRSIENARNVYGQFRLSLSEYTRGEKRERWDSQEKEERKKCEKREEHRKQKEKNRVAKTLKNTVNRERTKGAMKGES